MNIADVKFAMALLVQEFGTNALTAEMDAAGLTPTGALTVIWNQPRGGTLNPSTGAYAGAVDQLASGTLPALAVEEGVRTVLRQFSEIAVGDLLVTLAGDPQVTLAAGGAVPLASVAAFDPWFVWQGREYSQKEMSAELRGLWCEAVQGIALTQGMLLRRNP